MLELDVGVPFEQNEGLDAIDDRDGIMKRRFPNVVIQCGAGGVGANLFPYLVAATAGDAMYHIVLIDPDTISASNISRAPFLAFGHTRWYYDPSSYHRFVLGERPALDKAVHKVDALAMVASQIVDSYVERFTMTFVRDYCNAQILGRILKHLDTKYGKVLRIAIIDATDAKGTVGNEIMTAVIPYLKQQYDIQLISTGYDVTISEDNTLIRHHIDVGPINPQDEDRHYTVVPANAMAALLATSLTLQLLALGKNFRYTIQDNVLSYRAPAYHVELYTHEVMHLNSTLRAYEQEVLYEIPD